jgi:hypothetical protein
VKLLESVRDAFIAPPPHATDAELAEVLAWCLTLDEDWINRLVERIDLVDDETIRRQVSVDFTLPAGLAPEGATVYVPLALLRKEALTNFDVWQEDGARLSVLNTVDTVRVTVPALRSIADREAARQGLAPDFNLDPLLTQLAEGGIEAGRQARRDIEAGFAPLVAESGPFRTTVVGLTEGFPLLVPVEMRGGATRLIKLRYDVPIRTERLRRGIGWYARAPFEHVGWLPKRLEFELPGIERGEGYHLEVVAPVELDIRAASVRRLDVPGARKLTIAEASGKERVHLLPSRGHRRGHARLRAKMRPQRGGVMFAYVATSALAATELLLARPHVREIEPQTGSALLLLLPTLLAAFLVRPGEHTFAKRMLSGVRLLTAVTALAPLLAAGALALYGTKRENETPGMTIDRLDHLDRLWSMATLVACVAGAVLAVGYVVSARWPGGWLGRKGERLWRKRP